MAKFSEYLSEIKQQTDELRVVVTEKSGTDCSGLSISEVSAVVENLSIGSDAVLQEKTVDPSVVQQEILPDAGYDGLSKLTIKAVTSEIDSNILADNIKKDVTILGVTGSLEQGGAEDLTEELTAQDTALTSLEEAVDNLPKVKGGDGTWQPNSSWWDIETILENDQEDYKFKAIVLFDDSLDITTFSLSKYAIQKAKTSDGVEYVVRGDSTETINHSWNKKFDKACFVGGKHLYNTRYIIAYGSYSYLGAVNQDTIYYVSNGSTQLVNSSNNKTFTDMRRCYEFKLEKSFAYYNRANNSFYNCVNLRRADMSGFVNSGTELNNFSSMFYNCSSLEQVVGLNLYYASKLSSIFSGCSSLVDLDIKNVRQSLSLSASPLLCRTSIINTVKELWDMSSDTTNTYTLTLGTTNEAKIESIYIKLVDITDEMRAEDAYIDNKKPFIVCESTDEGAMLITEYVVSKNWTLA